MTIVPRSVSTTACLFRISSSVSVVVKNCGPAGGFAGAGFAPRCPACNWCTATAMKSERRCRSKSSHSASNIIRKMNFEWRTGARTSLLLILIASGCGGRNQPAPETHTAPAQEPPSGSGVELTGKLAASLAPPSAVVVVEPASPVELPVKAEPAIMDQAGYEFLPGFLIAQAGQNVQFWNSEDVLHNVRVTETSTQQPVFNVATLALASTSSSSSPDTTPCPAISTRPCARRSS